MTVTKSPVTSRFDEIFSIDYESVPISLHRDKITGISIAIAKVKSPTVHGYFALQTEVHDNYGLPHTLEHLVFLGSRDYPYKGVLDVLANRCLAQGTNAWTATDHTCYTIETAGSEGFLNILPVYLDHIIRPTLTDSGFTMEVHHINGEGEDSGVVYCEMQARENEKYDRMEYAVKQMLYPGNTGYKYETGGRLEDLRALNNTMVTDFHKKYYTTPNTCVCVTGQVDIEQLATAIIPILDKLEPQHMARLPARPFSTPVPKITQSMKKEIEFPAEDEATGASVWAYFHGPKWNDFLTLDALDVLRSYMCQDAVSPLRRTFVDCEKPFCGDIGTNSDDFLENTFMFMLGDVNMEQLRKRDIEKELFEAIGNDDIDLERLNSIINQKRRRHLACLESNPHDFFSTVVLNEFMYGPAFDVKPERGGKTLNEAIDVTKRYTLFEKWGKKEWDDLRKKWILDNPYVLLTGVPSKKCGEIIQKEDQERMKKQKEELKPEGLKKKKEIAEQAEENNDVDTPLEVCESFKLPDAANIKLIPVKNESKKSEKGAFVHWDRCSGAQFVTVAMYLKLPDNPLLLQYLSLWTEIAFELPLKESELGPAMTHEEVVRELTRMMVSQEASIGHGERFWTENWAVNNFILEAKCEKQDVEKAVKMLTRILEDGIFDEERLKAGASRIENAIPSKKRKGRDLMVAVLSALSVTDITMSVPHLDFFRLEKLIASDKFDVSAAQKRLNELRQSLGSMVCRVAGDIDNQVLPWPSKRSAGDFENFALWHQIALPPIGGGVIVSTAAIESNFWAITAAGPKMTDDNLETTAALMVAIEVLVALEGPFWRKIRGKGLAYSYSLRYNSLKAEITFCLSRAQSPAQAFTEAKKVVLGTGKKKGGKKGGAGFELKKEDVEAARSGVCYELISNVATIPDAMDDQFENFACRRKPGHSQKIMEHVMNVSEAKIAEALDTYIKPIFSGQVTRSFAFVCPETKVDEIQKYLTKSGFTWCHMDVASLEQTLSAEHGRSMLRRRVHNLSMHAQMNEERRESIRRVNKAAASKGGETQAKQPSSNSKSGKGKGKGKNRNSAPTSNEEEQKKQYSFYPKPQRALPN